MISAKSVLLSLASTSLIAIPSTYFFVKNDIEKQVQLKMDKLVALASPVGQLSYGKIQFKPYPLAIEIQKWQFKPHGQESVIQMDNFTLDNLDLESLPRILTGQQQITKALRLTLSGLKLPKSVWQKFDNKIMNDLGYEEFIFSFSTGVRFYPEDERFDVTDFWLEAEDVGRLSLQLSLGNIPFPQGEDFKALQSGTAAGQALMMKYVAASIRNLRVQFMDKSLTSRARYAYYQSSGIDILTQVAEAEQQTARAPASSAFAKRTQAAALAFLKKPGTISFGIQPAQPIAFLRLSSLFQGNIEEVATEVGAYWEVDTQKY